MNRSQTSLESSERKKRFKPHPKRFLKNIQQKLYTSPNMYLIFCFIAPMVVMYLAYIAKGIHPFTNGSPLVLDLNAQYVYFFEALREFVYGDNSLLYSFSRSLGGEFMGIYAYYMASPLTYIVALFPVTRIQEAVLCILLLKTGLSGLSFGYYLHKRSKNPNRLAVFIFSMLYALSAYAVVQQNNTMWIDALILLPLFVYGLENLITRRKYKLYVITLSAILIFNYYIGYMVCIFAVLYFFYYYFSKTKEEINPRAEKFHFVRAGSRFAAFSLLSAGIAAFMLIMAYYSLGFGKTEFSITDWSLKGNFEVFDFLTKLLPGAYDTVEPSGLPFVYCGLLAIILLPVYFVSKKISTREKICSASIVAVLLLSFIVSPLDLIWHGFSVPNWLNARYSFMFCFIVLVIAYKGFGNLRRTGEKFILVIGGLLLLMIATAEKLKFESYINSKEKLPTLACIWFSVFFTVALIVLLCLRIKIKPTNKRTTQSVSAVLVAVICIELLCNGIVCLLELHKDVAFTTYDSYQNSLAELRPVISQVEEYDDGFYRMEKVKHRTKNENMALGLKGLTSSTSTLNASAIQLVNYMGYTGRAHLTMYRGGTPFTDSLFGIKYVIDYETSERFDHVYNELEFVNSDSYKVMKNPYALSLAYGVDTDINKLVLDNYHSFFKRYNATVAALLGEKSKVNIFKPVYGLEATGSNCELTETSLAVKCNTGETNSGTVEFTYVAPYTGNYYFYSPVDRPKEMKVKFSGLMGSFPYLGNDTDHVLAAGYYEKDEIISIEITVPKDMKISFDKSYDFLWYLDSELYDSAMSRLINGPQFNIDPESTDDHLTGTISTYNSSQMILTTIPYDEGWNVYVDGEKVEIYKTLDALMAFDVSSAGDHTLELKYMPSCYPLGFSISILALLIFISLCVIELILKKTLFKNRIPEYPDEYWILEDFDEDFRCEEEKFSPPNKPNEEEKIKESEELSEEVTSDNEEVTQTSEDSNDILLIEDDIEEQNASESDQTQDN